MSALVNNLVRRGLEAVQEHGNEDEPQKIHLSRWGLTLCAVTVVVFVLASYAITYICAGVVATLVAIEDTNAEQYVQLNTEDNDNDNARKPTQPNGLEAGVAGISTQPITRKLRTTLRHLRARAGRFSSFRGLGLYLFSRFASGIVVAVFSVTPMTSSVVGRCIARIVGETAAASIQMAWVHAVISEPSSKRMLQRIPRGFAAWKKIAPAVALVAVASQVSFLLPYIVGNLMGIWNTGNSSNIILPEVDVENPYKYLGGSVASVTLLIALSLLIEVPAQVVFVRTAASMLPEDDEAIVPFDRSFGGKVVPEVIGGSGKIGMLEAWKSFGWQSRVRYVKVFGKMFLIEFALSLLFVFVIIGEIHLFAGSLKDLVNSLRGAQGS